MTKTVQWVLLIYKFNCKEIITSTLDDGIGDYDGQLCFGLFVLC